MVSSKPGLKLGALIGNAGIEVLTTVPNACRVKNSWFNAAVYLGSTHMHTHMHLGSTHNCNVKYIREGFRQALGKFDEVHWAVALVGRVLLTWAERFSPARQGPDLGLGASCGLGRWQGRDSFCRRCKEPVSPA